jgi:hypothetical protein
MNLQGLTLAEVAAVVNEALRAEGIRVVVVGGSAITIHAPDVYTSYDIDLAVVTGIDRRAIARTLAKLQFRRCARPVMPFPGTTLHGR